MSESTKEEKKEGAESKEETEVKKDDAEEKEPEEKEQEEKETEEKEATEKEKTAKKKTQNWPLHDVKEPHENDVLYGRGGGTNHHPGNKRYRKMVEGRKVDYVNSKRLDKPLVALEIIREWRGQDPPGRFLKLDEKTGTWQDVGDKKAREKTSQALREKAPLIRKQQEEGQSRSEDEEETDRDDSMKNTRFAEGTKSGDQDGTPGVRRAVLARDHSLGREYVAPGDPVSLEGFSWEEPIVQLNGQPGPPRRSYSSGRTSSSSSMGVPPPPGGYPNGPISSSSSMGGPPYPPRTGSQGAPPPPQDYAGYDKRQFSGTRYESWGSLGSASFPPPAMPYSQYPYDRSGGSVGYDYTPPYTAIQREHSLSGNVLREASISQPMPPDCFESQRSNSGYGWTEAPSMPPPPPNQGGPAPSWSSQPPPPRYPSDGGFSRTHSGRSNGEMPMERTPSGREYRTPPPSYAMDPDIARTWSSQSEDYEQAANVIAESQSTPTGRTQHNTSSNNPSPRRKHGRSQNGQVQDTKSGSNLPRPTTVKRATSNQNENVETKRDLRGTCVKRAALNRDNSLASNRLKAQYPADKVGKHIFDSEMRSLSTSMEQSTLDSAEAAKPKPLSSEDRTSTIDKIAMDLFVKPEPLKGSSRSSTIEALSIDFDDPFVNSDAFIRDRVRTSSSDALLSELDAGPAKPPALSSEGRVSTMDAFYADISIGPIGDGDKQPTVSAPLDLSRGASVSDWLKEV